MANNSTSPEAQSKAQKLKAIGASAVIAVCAIWLGYQWFASRPVTVVAEPPSPAAKFALEARVLHHDPRFEYVIIVASEDGQSVDVSGKVASASDLAEAKAKIDEVAAANPGVATKFTVVVGRIP